MTPPPAKNANDKTGNIFSRAIANKYKDRIKRRISKKEIDKSRRFITYRVYMVFCGLFIMWTCIQYKKLKHRFYFKDGRFGSERNQKPSKALYNSDGSLKMDVVDPDPDPDPDPHPDPPPPTLIPEPVPDPTPNPNPSSSSSSSPPLTKEFIKSEYSNILSLISSDQPDTARESITSTLLTNPPSSPTFLLSSFFSSFCLGMIEMNSNFDLAVDHFKSALHLQIPPSDEAAAHVDSHLSVTTDINYMLAEMHFSCSTPSRRSTSPKPCSSQVATQSQSFLQTSLHFVSKATTSSDPGARAHRLKALIEEELGDFQSASTSLTRAIEIIRSSRAQTTQNQSHPLSDYYAALCDIQLNMGDLLLARKTCNIGIKNAHKDSSFMVYSTAAALEHKVGNYPQSVKHTMSSLEIISSLLTENVNSVDANTRLLSTKASLHANAGINLLAMNSHTEAEKQLKLAFELQHKLSSDSPIRIDNGEGLSIFHLGRSFYKANKFNQAADLFTSLLSTISNNATNTAGWHVANAYAEAAKNDFSAAYSSIKEGLNILKNSDGIDESKFFTSAIHKFPACNVIDSQIDNKANLLTALRLSNYEDVVPESFLLPQELGKFLKIVDDDDDVDDEKNVWIVKPVEGADGAGITILSSTTEVVEHIRNNPNQFVVVSKYLTNPILFQSKKTDFRAYALSSGVFPIQRVYVHKPSTLVRSAPSNYTTTASELANRTIHLTASEEDSFFANKKNKNDHQIVGFDEVIHSLLSETSTEEFDVTIQGNSASKELLFNVRQENLGTAWQNTKRNIGKTFEASWNAERGKFVSASRKRNLDDGEVWKLLMHATNSCRHKIYGVDILFEYANDRQVGLLGGVPKTYVLEVNRNPGIGRNWNFEPEKKIKKVTDAAFMMASDLKDRIAFRAIAKGEARPENIAKKTSKRLSWALQFVTKELCPGYKKDKENDNEKCDMDKNGFYALELALATLEYERKGADFELAYPVDKVVVGEFMTLDRELKVLKNLFVGWIEEFEIGKREAKKTKEEKER